MLKQHQLDTVCSTQERDEDLPPAATATAAGGTSPPDSPAVIPITQELREIFMCNNFISFNYLVLKRLFLYQN